MVIQHCFVSYPSTLRYRRFKMTKHCGNDRMLQICTWVHIVAIKGLTYSCIFLLLLLLLLLFSFSCKPTHTHTLTIFFSDTPAQWAGQLRHPESKCPELLANYCDLLLRKTPLCKKLMSEEIDSKLKSVVRARQTGKHMHQC